MLRTRKVSCFPFPNFCFFLQIPINHLDFPLVICKIRLMSSVSAYFRRETGAKPTRLISTRMPDVRGNNLKWKPFCPIHEFSNTWQYVNVFTYCSCWEEQSFCHCFHHDECAMHDGNVIYAVVQEIASSSGLHSCTSESRLNMSSFRLLIISILFQHPLRNSIEFRYFWIHDFRF